MAAQSSKRSFDEFKAFAGATALPTERLRAQPSYARVCNFDLESLREIAAHAYLSGPSTAWFIESKHAALLAAKAAEPPKNFDWHSKECWYALNIRNKRMKSSHQVDAMGGIFDTLSDSREQIMEDAGPNERFETRRNALEVLRKICKSIMLCDERLIRHEIMKDGHTLGEFADSMCELAKGMKEEEREAYKDEGLFEKLEELKTLCDNETDMPKLQALLGIFGDDEVEDERENDNEDDEGNEDD